MYLSEINIKNFRLFESLDLNLNRGLNVLVGENDAGKTALVDAIRYALGTNSNDRAYISEQDFFNDTTALSIQLKFSDVDKHAYRFVEHLSYEEYKTDKGELKLRSVLYVQFSAKNTQMERRGYPYIKTEVRSGADGNGRVIESEIRDFLAATYLMPLRDAPAELSTGRASRLSQILSSSKDIREGMETILTAVAEANAALVDNGTALKNAAGKIESQYLHKLIFESDKLKFGAYIDIAGIKKDEFEDLPDHVKKRHLREVLERLSLALSDDRHMHGLGYHNLLFMAAELLLLEQEAGNEFPLLLIEEPEAHLHPQLQMKLLQFINEKVASAKRPDGIQCILSTHSPNISSKADPSEVIMLAGGKAWPLKAGETELNADDYIFLRKFLDATKANVFFAKALLFVEGDAENIFLPELARLLGRPLENYGVSIVKYDNSGSWKRFAKLFLCKGKDGEKNAWHPTKVCVLRDLDLWPDCAEEKEDDSNPYGFNRKKYPNASGKGGNLDYWLKTDAPEQIKQINKRKENLKKDNDDTLERQWVRVYISDNWTFEYCLAKYGFFEECCKALDLECDGLKNATIDEKATLVLKKVSKTDFAYKLAEILQKQLKDKIQERGDNPEQNVKSEFADNLRKKLPKYILEAIDYVTENKPVEGE
jgi:putative ATP-dependent endonuclease of OLD family